MWHTAPLTCIYVGFLFRTYLVARCAMYLTRTYTKICGLFAGASRCLGATLLSRRRNVPLCLLSLYQMCFVAISNHVGVSWVTREHVMKIVYEHPGFCDIYVLCFRVFPGRQRRNCVQECHGIACVTRHGGDRIWASTGAEYLAHCTECQTR